METRDAIMEAFCSCLMGKRYDTISVGDICAEANISKKTYYNYFQTKMDIVSAVIDRDFYLPQRQMRKSLYPEQLRSNTLMLLELTFKTLYRRRDFYLKLIGDIGKNTFLDIFTELSREMNSEIYIPLNDLSPDEQAELDYACMFLAATSANSLLWWIERDFSPSPEKAAGLYLRWGFGYLNSVDTPFHEMVASTARR